MNKTQPTGKMALETSSMVFHWFLVKQEEDRRYRGSGKLATALYLGLSLE